MGFTYKDMHNMLLHLRANVVSSGNVHKVLRYFDAKKVVDLGFFFVNTFTSYGELEHMF